MEKNLVRKLGIKRLNELAQQPELKQAKEQLLYQKLFSSTVWQSAKSIGITFSMAAELNTAPIIEQAFLSGKIVTVPKTYPKRVMHFLEISPETEFSLSSFGVQEPLHNQIYENKIDLLLVPGVVYNREHYRIGFGGGFYDRYLEKFTGQTLSLVFREQFNEGWAPAPFDIKIQQLMSE